MSVAAPTATMTMTARMTTKTRCSMTDEERPSAGHATRWLAAHVAAALHPWVDGDIEPRNPTKAMTAVRIGVGLLILVGSRLLIESGVSLTVFIGLGLAVLIGGRIALRELQSRADD